MKKIILGMLTIIGLTVIVGNIGAMENNLISVNEAVCKILSGGALLCLVWIVNQICKIFSTVKRCNDRVRDSRLKKSNVIQFRHSA